MPFAAAAAVGAVGTIAGSVIQAGATRDAQSSANAAQREAEARARADQAPWTTAGANALNMTGDLSGANGVDAGKLALANYQQSPGYQWAYGEGMRAIDASASAKGMLRSGAQIKAAEQFGQGLANQDFSTYYNRLADISKIGQAAASNQAASSNAAGAGIAQTNLSTGQAQANIYGNAAQGLGNIANSYASNSLYQDRTNALMATPNVTPGYVAPVAPQANGMLGHI